MQPEKRPSGRPKTPPELKKRKFSVYLHPRVIAKLEAVDPNISRAIEILIERKRAALRGAAIMDALRQQKHPGSLAVQIHLQQLSHDEIPAAVDKLLYLLGELKS